MFNWYKADLHIHTALSPCADLLMGPINIIKQALKRGVDILAITDHNSAENVRAVQEAAVGRGITIIPGIEVTTAENAHIICLFTSLKDVLALQKIVYDNLPTGKNDTEIFGEQFIVNYKNEILGLNSRLLISSTTLKVKELIRFVNERNGVAYPAHVDRRAYSLVRQLGFIPEDLKFPAVEISSNADKNEVKTQFPFIAGYNFIQSSDAHQPEDVGTAYTMFYLKSSDLNEIKKALLNENGRMIKML